MKSGDIRLTLNFVDQYDYCASFFDKGKSVLEFRGYDELGENQQICVAKDKEYLEKFISSFLSRRSENMKGYW